MDAFHTSMVQLLNKTTYTWFHHQTRAVSSRLNVVSHVYSIMMNVDSVSTLVVVQCRTRAQGSLWALRRADQA